MRAEGAVHKVGHVFKTVEDAIVAKAIKLEADEKHILKLLFDYGHLAALFGIDYDPLRQLGITGAVRFILAGREAALSHREIVLALKKRGYGADRKNLASNVRTILRRLRDAGLVDVGEASGVETYRARAGERCPLPPLPDRVREEVARRRKLKALPGR